MAQRALRLFVLLTWLLAASCAASTPPPQPPSSPAPAGGSCQLGLDPAAGDEEIIRAVLAAEGELVVAQDITRLMGLWVEESQVVDAKNTPDDTADDQRWDGKDAIRHRYVRTVFPGAPATVQPADLEISLNGDRATVRATTQIGAEVSPAGDRWDLVKQGGCWYIAGLTYNLEPSP
ncbi:MAG TPA: hypothetical protein VNK95_07750 [Caldilineaceae bacterium]|nr:hypothetical protein [Caldilineaceae bacterium]